MDRPKVRFADRLETNDYEKKDTLSNCDKTINNNNKSKIKIKNDDRVNLQVEYLEDLQKFVIKRPVVQSKLQTACFENVNTNKRELINSKINKKSSSTPLTNGFSHHSNEDDISEVVNNVAKLSISDTLQKQEKIRNQNLLDNDPSSNKRLSNGFIQESERISNQHHLNVPSSNKSLSNGLIQESERISNQNFFNSVPSSNKSLPNGLNEIDDTLIISDSNSSQNTHITTRKNLIEDRPKELICLEDSDSDSDLEIIKVLPKSNLNKTAPEVIEKANKYFSSSRINKTELLKKNKSDTHKTKIYFKDNVPERKKQNVMPCAKYNFSKNLNDKYMAKSTAVKKSAVFNACKKPSKVCVVPASSHDKLPNVSETIQENSKKTDPENILARPEYNSSLHIMKKQKEMENEKIIKDVSKLPPKYKSFLNREVSTALNFPLNEPVYKDLVNLSVDKRKLPTPLMRTKDPIPRNKDIVPELSNFFKAKCYEPFFANVSQYYPATTKLNNRHSSKVAKKIFTWKSVHNSV